MVEPDVGTSISVGQLDGCEPIQADAGFGCFDGELTVDIGGNSNHELPTEFAAGQRLGHRLVRFLHVCHDVCHDASDPLKFGTQLDSNPSV